MYKRQLLALVLRVDQREPYAQHENREYGHNCKGYEPRVDGGRQVRLINVAEPVSYTHLREILGFMTWDVPTKDNCPECGNTMFKRSGRGRSKPFCINPDCPNYLPPEQRGYKPKKAASEDKDAQGEQAGEDKDGQAEAKKSTAAKKTAASKKTAAAKKTTAKKTAAEKKTTTRKKAASTEEAV